MILLLLSLAIVLMVLHWLTWLQKRDGVRSSVDHVLAQTILLCGDILVAGTLIVICCDIGHKAIQ